MRSGYILWHFASGSWLTFGRILDGSRALLESSWAFLDGSWAVLGRLLGARGWLPKISEDRPGQRKAAQDSARKPRASQHSPEAPRTAQDSPGSPKTDQETDIVTSHGYGVGLGLMEQSKPECRMQRYYVTSITTSAVRVHICPE